MKNRWSFIRPVRVSDYGRYSLSWRNSGSITLFPCKIIDEIVKLENIQTTDEEVQQQLEKIALYNNTSKEEVLKHVEPENLRNDFNRVKASQLIIESAVVIE